MFKKPVGYNYFSTYSPDSYRDYKLIKGVSLALTHIAMCEEK
jgi:hypothetical protein